MTISERDEAFPRRRTRRPSSRGAEYWLGRKIPCLDKGFAYLADYMGNDLSIEQAARVSYGQGTRSVDVTTGLIRYLRRNDHTTPFEMAELKLHLMMPLFVARQWMRHRTASINEYSLRYSEARDLFYIPAEEDIAVQSSANRQGRGEPAAEDAQRAMREMLAMTANQAYDYYTELLETHQIARELARTVLPVSLYTEFYWKIDLHNLMHFLKLRMDPHAQREIRVFATAIDKIFNGSFPIAHQAFVDYELNSVKLSRLEQMVLKHLAGVRTPHLCMIGEAFNEARLTNQRERLECYAKLHLFGILVKPFDREEFEAGYLAELGQMSEAAVEKEWLGLSV